MSQVVSKRYRIHAKSSGSHIKKTLLLQPGSLTYKYLRR